MGIKKTFTLTKADIELIDTVLSTMPYALLYPRQGISTIMTGRMLTVWKVLGEKHGFKGKSSEPHPEGEPKILATPNRKIT